MMDSQRMQAEDFRSRAYEHLQHTFELNRTIGQLKDVIQQKDYLIACKEKTIVEKCEEIE